MSQTKPRTTILCFGDSLTAGFQTPLPGQLEVPDTPYGGFLQEALGDAARVLISGMCGELTGEMLQRFRESVIDLHPTYVIILGGTNDLGWNGRPADIMRNLLKMYELAQHHDIEPIALSVPSIRPTGMEGSQEAEAWVQHHITQRLTLNQGIQNYCQSHSLHFIDVFQATIEPSTRLLAQQYSNDGLHLTTQGYQCIAQLLVDQVFCTTSSLTPSSNPTHT